MTDPSRDDHPSRDARFRAKKGHIWRGVGVSAEARPVDPPMAGCREAEGFPDAGRCGRKNRQEHDLDVARQHARTEPGCMIRTEMWSFSCIQVLFIGVSQAHRAVDQRLRTCERRDSALAPLRQLTSRRDNSPAPLRRITSRRDSALAPLRQLTSRRDSFPGPATADHQPPRRANEADAGRLGPAPTPRSRCGRRSTVCGTCPRDRRACTCERRSNHAGPG